MKEKRCLNAKIIPHSNIFCGNTSKAFSRTSIQQKT